MDNNILYKINDKLYKLMEDFNQLYPQFYLAELAYTQKKAELMLGTVGLGTQQLRDSEVLKMLSQTKEYKQYHKLYPEYQVIQTQLAVYKQISRNLSTASWAVSNG